MPPPPRTPRPPVPPPPGKPRFDLERLVGVNLFAWIAGVALVFAAIFFLKYSIDHGWIGPPIRMVIGLLTGVSLLVACELKAARRYPVTANALDASGIAILFSTLFASHALWKLLPQLPVFVLMALVTAVAVLLSIRRDSIFIALLGLLGGFATPALLSTGEDRPIGLFGYLLILNVGLAWVAHRKRWPALTTVSVVFTALYQWAWVARFFSASRLPLALGIFLVFPLASAASLWLGEAGKEKAERHALFAHTAALGSLLPLLFALFLATVPAYGQRYGLLFGYLLILDLGLWLLAATKGPGGLHLGSGMATLLVWAIWFAISYHTGAWPLVLGLLAAFVLLYLLGGPMAGLLHRPLSQAGETAIYTAPLLLFAYPVLAAMEPKAAEPGTLFGALFLTMAALATAAILTGRAKLHVLASLFSLTATAIWSANHLTPERLLPALAVYGGFGLFYLGVPVAAERWGRPLQPEGTGGVLAFLSLGLLFFLTAGPIAAVSLWGLALLLAILNFGLLIEAASGRLPRLAALGMVVSWVVLAFWWMNGPVSSMLVPSLLVVAGLAVLAAFGSLWASARAEVEGAEEEASLLSGPGLYLSLVGHLFLLFVASRPTLAIPPWPLFGVLAVLDLALAAAALYARRGGLQAAAVTASQFILLFWVGVSSSAPWPKVAIVASGVVVLVSLVFLRLSAIRGVTGNGFALAALSSVFLAQVVALEADMGNASPGLTWITADHVLLLIAMLGLAWVRQWHVLAALAVVPTAIAGFEWQAIHLSPETWTSQMVFAGSLYLPFLAYPLLLGARAGRSREPYLGAVLASIPFFFLARQAMETGGYGGVIGLLPVTQALLLCVLLVQLLRIEPPGERTAGRLALVAGAALAFVTVAIPLQLDREWITIGWALEGAALAWLYRRIPHRGLLLWSAGLCAAVFVRLCLNPAVFSYHPRGAYPIWNWYLYTYLIAALAFLVTARFLRGVREARFQGLPSLPSLLSAAAAVLLFLLLNIEIADFYSEGPALTFDFSAGLAQDLSYTIGWALFALGLLVIGIARGQRLVRLSSLILLVVTVFKCFLHDLWRLGGLYRVGSFLGLAVCLFLVTLLLQKFVLKAQEQAP